MYIYKNKFNKLINNEYSRWWDNEKIMKNKPSCSNQALHNHSLLN